jgi:hypothetical protein
MGVRGTTGSIGGLAPAVISYGTTNVSAVTVLGGSGSNTYTVANTASNGGLGVLTTLVPGGGADMVIVRATTGALIVNAGAGNNSITVGDAGSTLNGIREALTVNGLPGSNLLILNDQGNRANQIYTLATGTLTRAGLATITYAGMQNLVLNSGQGANHINIQSPGALNATIINGGSGSNTIQLQSTAAGSTTTINGGSDTTTLVGADGGGIWRITGINEGSLSGTAVDGLVTFGNVQNLIGGSGNNTFIFTDGASISGRLDGGQRGTNMLDLSPYTSTVIVDLQLGLATGVGGGIVDIQNVSGGNGGPTGSYNILVGNANGDSNILIGGLGRRNLLIAGTTPGMLIGGDEEDILIGGKTAYDMDLSALLAIMAEWTRTDEDYATRVGNLLNGTSSPILDATTVSSNGGGNTLLGHVAGSTEMNLFYGLDPGLETTDWNPALGEVFVNV